MSFAFHVVANKSRCDCCGTFEFRATYKPLMKTVILSLPGSSDEYRTVLNDFNKQVRLVEIQYL